MNGYFLLFIFFSLVQQIYSKTTFDFKAFELPAPEKGLRGGQDAHIATSELIVVSDGVGGWNSIGINPSKYSKFLVNNSVEVFQKNKEYYNQNLRQLIKIVHQNNQEKGSATYLSLSIKDNKINSCNIGDCQFLVYRPNKDNNLELIYDSVQQQHSFNYPYQLVAKGYDSDTSQSAICASVDVKDNDVIIVGSDGLFDNIFQQQIQKLLQKAIDKKNLLTNFPQMLVKKAINYGQSETYRSPFSRQAEKVGILFRGGKTDDTTCIVARVKEQPERTKHINLKN